MLQTNRRGFTMVESIMVVSIIGVVAAIGGPKISSALQRRTTPRPLTSSSQRTR